jgi:oligopeptide transport system ATP-binding protein
MKKSTKKAKVTKVTKPVKEVTPVVKEEVAPKVSPTPVVTKEEAKKVYPDVTKNPETKEEPILQVKHLKMYFPIQTGFFKTKTLKAVDDVSFFVKKGETLGVVGESGCGKTTLGRTILHLYKPTDGDVIFKGREIKSKEDIEFLHMHAQMVFQDPYSSLDPRMTVEDIIAEPLDAHKLYHKDKDGRHKKVLELMSTVGLSPEQASRYPHEFSGGQRQRIGIARALALNPDLLVCDEPVSALDVSIQAQVLNTFEELQRNLHLTYIFIAHNLLVVKHISDRIAVMYLGHIVELAETEKLFKEPMHPYTVSLLSAIPVPDPEKARKNERVVLKGDIPSPLNAPSGCPFRSRCPFAKEACALVKGSLPLREVRKGHYVACLFPLQAGRSGM